MEGSPKRLKRKERGKDETPSKRLDLWV